MTDENKKNLEKLIDKVKRKFNQNEKTRTFKDLQKVSSQEMTIDEKFQFISEALESEKLSLGRIVEIFCLLFKLKDEIIANNQSSRMLNETITQLQKEMK